MDCVQQKHATHERIVVDDMQKYWQDKMEHVAQHVTRNMSIANTSVKLVKECSQEMRLVANMLKTNLL